MGGPDLLSNEEFFERLLDVMLPRGGHVVMQVEAYFDESGSHSGSHVLCVAGYVMTKRGAIQLSREWNKVLKQKDLPYFRMVDCAHGNGPFRNLSKAERIYIAKKMIEIIKTYTLQGVAATIDVAEYDSLMPRHELIGTAYSLCTHVVVAGVSKWIKTNEHVPIEQCAFFFEAGHRSRNEANRIMGLLFDIKKMKESHRYAGHAFIEKESTPAIQAADLLAWQWYTDKRHELEGRPRRKDCESLLQHHHNVVHVDRSRILTLARRFGPGVIETEEEMMERLHVGDPR